jgi:hypothetical protein
MGDTVEEEDLTEEPDDGASVCAAAVQVMTRQDEAGGWVSLLGTESELDRDAALHFAEDAPDGGPVHCVAEAVARLLKVVVCDVLRDPERFVQVRPADVEIGDHVAAA